MKKLFKFEGGSFEVAEPNVAEGLRIKGRVIRKSLKESIADDEVLSNDEILAFILEEMGDVVSSIKLPGKKKAPSVEGTFSELLLCKEARAEVCKAADFVSSEIFIDSKKKA